MLKRMLKMPLPIRGRLTLIAIRSLCFFAILAPWLCLAAEPASPTTQLQKIDVKVDAMDAAKLASKPGVRTFAAEKDVAAALGEKLAQQLSGKVDFATQQLVFVTWGSSGPPFGHLKNDVTGPADKPEIAFFIDEPKATIRGQAYRLGAEFFTAPASAKVSFRK